MKRSFYEESIVKFLRESENEILGKLTSHSDYDVTRTQREAWIKQIKLLQVALANQEGYIYFEYIIPRIGKRIDVLIIRGSVIYILEFKVGEFEYSVHAIDQTWDYALDLKNFHSTSHNVAICPVLVATNAEEQIIAPQLTQHDDKVLRPITINSQGLSELFNIVEFFVQEDLINPDKWSEGRYSPTPTIVEAAKALYKGHSVESISRNDAGAVNLTKTTEIISEIIKDSKAHNKKSICFVTGVPGAGKTLVGLDIAHKHIDKDSDMYSVYLSGNGPLVSVLREALARDRVGLEKLKGNKLTKKDARRDVSLFIQNVHHFRDDCLRDCKAPIEHVALFDEAQRAWNKSQTIDFMRRKKGLDNFNQSEPEFLISCLDRHEDWATIVCLVGGGQEIHTGEGGIAEWVSCLIDKFPEWNINISSRLTDTEYGAGEVINKLKDTGLVVFYDDLHLATSMRSFRAENVSKLVKHILDQDVSSARQTLVEVNKTYPIVITRDIKKAKAWVKKQARGSERYGMIVSS